MGKMKEAFDDVYGEDATPSSLELERMLLQTVGNDLHEIIDDLEELLHREKYYEDPVPTDDLEKILKKMKIIAKYAT